MAIVLRFDSNAIVAEFRKRLHEHVAECEEISRQGDDKIKEAIRKKVAEQNSLIIARKERAKNEWTTEVYQGQLEHFDKDITAIAGGVTDIRKLIKDVFIQDWLAKKKALIYKDPILLTEEMIIPELQSSAFLIERTKSRHENYIKGMKNVIEDGRISSKHKEIFIANMKKFLEDGLKLLTDEIETEISNCLGSLGEHDCFACLVEPCKIPFDFIHKKTCLRGYYCQPFAGLDEV